MKKAIGLNLWPLNCSVLEIYKESRFMSEINTYRIEIYLNWIYILKWNLPQNRYREVTAMSSFSTIACYAALSSCSREDILHAYARMIAALIQRNRYKTCDTDTLCKDFKAYYGFSVPYHPMQTILFTCIKSYIRKAPNLIDFLPIFLYCKVKSQTFTKGDYIKLPQTNSLRQFKHLFRFVVQPLCL